MCPIDIMYATIICLGLLQAFVGCGFREQPSSLVHATDARELAAQLLFDGSGQDDSIGQVKALTSRRETVIG
jgi:hypothetical protein